MTLEIKNTATVHGNSIIGSFIPDSLPPTIRFQSLMSSGAKNALSERYRALLNRLRAAEARFDRPSESVQLVAVSKTYPADDVRAVAELGQLHFGENQLQDAMQKIPVLADLGLTWHFIGPVQSNKCKDVARHFDWVHSVDRFKIADRLSQHRPQDSLPLNLLIQVNIQSEATKAGVAPDALTELAEAVSSLSHVTLRGLMAIPAPETDIHRQREVFQQLRVLLERTNRTLNMKMDCLSMGMTDDMEAAIAEGATHVRIGTAIFGARQKPLAA
jgi:pyridoxal phosphate enzyme (YggS family)